ncbi:MAG: hypothetical protein JRE28_15520 [Deltaproteobacteria bacterium]|nr:hypothetical protein [Deltaproteobacteria bacterium]
MLDRIIFGDNQFFGINHMSEEKAQAQYERFRNVSDIIDVVDIAFDAGIKAFMFNSHGLVKDICDHFRNDPDRYADLRLYVSMPYAHKYASAVADKGIFGALKDTIISGSSASDVISMLTKGGFSLFEKDMLRVAQILVDIEMKMFHDLNVKVIFIQNIVTDLLLGFGVKEVFTTFADHIRNNYGAEPGFVTLNLPRLVTFLSDCGIENPIVCSAINKAGYFMNPDIETYEKTLKEKKVRPIAMSILASGAVKPEEAVEYVCRQPAIQSVVFGASSKKHIVETKNLIERYLH